MMTELEKMQAGQWYDANYDEELLAIRRRAEDLCYDFNHTRPSDPAAQELLHELLPGAAADAEVLAPVTVDFGTNVTIGERCHVNHGAYLMDGAPITIGHDVFIGPNCGMYTAQHPLVAEERNRGLERALPITVEDDVWIGGDVTIMPGVTIGRGSVIGGKSLVTHDIPAGVVAVGVPCKPVRPITDADRIEA